MFENLSVRKINRGLAGKEFSTLELAKHYLGKIRKENGKIHAFLNVFEDSVFEKAKEIDKMIAQKKPIPLLAGVPLAVKDNILVKGFPCTASSKILENYIAPYNATCIEKLNKEKVLILGKTNLDEFAMGSSTENSAFGPTKNPLDLERVPGGSSGGSGASVAADFSLLALGSDTGGSIRQPASFCGIVGFKPTYGVVSRYGLIAFASSLDQIGPMAKSVDDCQILFEAIKGKDDLDSTSVDLAPLKNLPKVSGLRIGVPKEYFIEGTSKEVIELVKKAILKYQSLGAKVLEISLPHTEYALACYYIIAPCEASANLARYDGVKYGFSRSGADLIDSYLETRAKGFGKEVKRRIMLGTYSLSSGYYDAYYVRAQKVRSLVKQDFDKAFREVDVIITPTCPTTAFKFGEKSQDPVQMYLSDIFTVSINLAGLPAISLPCGNVKGLSVGLQIIGKAFHDKEVIEIAKVFEQNN